MGDIGRKPEWHGAPGQTVDRIVQIARPLVIKALALAKTLPPRARTLIQRAELPRRLDQGRQWIVAQEFPSKARKAGLAASATGRRAIASACTATATVAATTTPLVASSVERLAAMVKRLAAVAASHSMALSAALDKKRAAAAARKAERRAVAKPEKASMPVPSELMRLLQEEGIEVDGDVREALPKPVRPPAVQGVLPLFADEPPAPRGQGR